MLSTVVLPAPFGPIRLVTAPGFASSAMSCAARMPPKAMPRLCTFSVAPAPRARAVCSSAEARRGRCFVSRRKAVPTRPSGASHRTNSSRAPKKSSRYSASAARNSGSSTTIVAPTRGPAVKPAPPIITTSTNRIDCEKAKVDGVTKPESAADPGEQCGDGEGGGLDAHWRKADRFGGDLGVAYRSHGFSESGFFEDRVPQRGKRSDPDRQEGNPAFAEPGWREGPHQAVLPAGQAAPFHGGVLDDEAEGDGDHREVRAPYAHRGKREQRAGQRGDQRRDRQRGPEAPLRRGEDRDRVGAERVEADVAEGHLAGESEQHVQADADDRGDAEHRHDEHVVLVRAPRERERGGEHHDVSGEPHTFFTSARPNSPLGISASATITSAKLRICV